MGDYEFEYVGGGYIGAKPLRLSLQPMWTYHYVPSSPPNYEYILKPKQQQKKGKPMRFFLDTEFHHDGLRLELVSIALVSEDGREYYAASYDFDLDSTARNDWLRTNMLPLLPPSKEWKSEHQIRQEIMAFVGKETPEFWGDCCGFDYVVMTQLFGGMALWPEGWPYYFNDVRQGARLGGVVLPEQTSGQHDALADARHVKMMWDVLQKKGWA